MNKEIIKKGFDAAEQEHQEQEVKKVKEIVQKHLEKIAYHREQAREHSEKEKLLKKDLDDLKAGRLDRIEERQGKDEKAKEVRIIEVHKIIEQYIPLRPWYSPYQIVWASPNYGTTVTNTLTSGTSLVGTGSFTVSSNASLGVLTGATCSNFVGGSYSVGSNTINL